MKKGQKNRKVRKTLSNINSSRSHTIFQILIQTQQNNIIKVYLPQKRSKINLCDLAGSQKVNKNYVMEQQHFLQLKSINLSLTTLGRLIWNLTSNQKELPPYRDSKLTRLLQDSIGGNSYTTIIANITSKKQHLQQTIRTLKFVERAHQVKTVVKAVEIEKKQFQLVQELLKEINHLKELLKIKNFSNKLNSSVEQQLIKLKNENNNLKKKLLAQQELADIKKENQLLKKQLHQNTNGKIQLKSTQENNQKQEIISQNKIFSELTIKKNFKKKKDHRIQSLNYKQSILKRIEQIERINIQNKQKMKKDLENLQKDKIKNQKTKLPPILSKEVKNKPKQKLHN